jgi:hypothetical protein
MIALAVSGSVSLITIEDVCLRVDSLVSHPMYEISVFRITV